MHLTLDVTTGPEQNASRYFEKAKQAKRKLAGAETALQEGKRRLAALSEVVAASEAAQPRKAAKEWYEKFRWFRSSDGFLCVGGRDATSNEILIKKHTEKDDLVFHTDMAGSPFFVVKSEGKRIGAAVLEEAAIATASFSRGWKLGVSVMDVFYVNPEQVSKTPRSGEYLGKGAFVISGKTIYLRPTLGIAIGMIADGKIMSGPFAAVQKHCNTFVRLMQGGQNASDVAKAIKKKIGGELDDIIRALPTGGCRIA